MDAIFAMIILIGSPITLGLFGWCMVSEWQKRHSRSVKIE